MPIRRAVGAALTVVVGFALVVAVPGAAQAGGAGEWTQLSAHPADNSYPRGANLDEPTLARFGSDLQVVWRSDLSTSQKAYTTAVVGPSGATVTPSTALLSGWSALVENPRLLARGGQRMLVFSGLKGPAADPYSKGAVYYALGSSATSWGLGVGSLSRTESAYASNGFDALDDAGTPVWAGNPGSTNGLTWHAGISPTIPAPAGSDESFLLSDCCAYEAAVARDGGSGAVYGSFFSNSDVGSEKGIWVGQLRPSAGGWGRAPNSYTTYNGAIETDSPDQRIAMVARAGGGIYLAYGAGYPTTTSIQLWRVGSPAPLTVPGSGGARNVTLAAAPDGSLWVAWVTANSDAVRVVHTNTSVTSVGAVRSIGTPPGYGQFWTTALDASGPVDLVVTAQNANGAINVFHQQVTEALRVVVSPVKIGAGGTVKVTVSVATGPVKGATVKAFGGSYTTNKKGRAVVTVPGGAGKGKATITAKRSPYGKGKTTVKVT